MIKGIDVSSWQGIIDFEKVRQDGICFCVCKAGGSDAGAYIDKRFYENVAKATKAGIPCGAYYFVGKSCTSYEAGKADAERFERIIRSVKLLFPVYIDFEAPDSLNKQGNTDACKAFCAYMESKGYYVGIYASDISGFNDRLYLDQLSAYDKWVARYGSEPKYVSSWGMWQSASNGNIAGIKGHVDLDYSKRDYSQIIRNKHLNGW